MNTQSVVQSAHSYKKTARFFKKVIARWQLSLFFLPAFLYLVIFCYEPMFGLQIAFRQYTPVKGIWGSDWVGFKHFNTFFKSYQFLKIIRNTVTLSLYGLLLSFPLSITFALALNTVRNHRAKKLIQTITYIPHFISVVVMVGIMNQVLNPVNGLYATLSRMMTGIMYPPDILGNPEAFSHMYVLSGIWQNLGWNSIVYIAALSNVDMTLHEAAEIDGATRLKRVIHIDLPTVLPTASIMLILNAGSIMNVGFEKVYLMQNTLNAAQSEVISTYVYKVGLNSGANFSYGTAIGMFNSVINCAMLILVNWIAKKLNAEGGSLW